MSAKCPCARGDPRCKLKRKSRRFQRLKLRSLANQANQRANEAVRGPAANRISRSVCLKGFSREALAEAASTIDCGAVLVGLLKSKKEKTRMEALIFLRDTMIGRPAQNVQLSGGVIHAHTVWRPLANLSDEEVQLLDGITKKLTAPAVSNASPDAHQNQIESKPALEAEIMSGAPPMRVAMSTCKPDIAIE